MNGGSRKGPADDRNSVAFRSLSASDIDNKLEAFIGISSDVPSANWTRDQYLSDLPEKWLLSFAVWKNEQPVAYAILSRKGPEQIHLHRIMITSSARGQGLGRCMLSEMKARARSAGARRLTLKVASSNVRARAFYAANGMRDVGREREYVVMEWAEAR